MTDSERIAILGGTFTPIHNGHRALLHKAFQTASHDGSGAGHVVVGLTSTDLAERTRSDPTHVDLLGSFRERREALAAELDRTCEAYTASYGIVALEDTSGPAATREDADALVVSPEAKAQRRAHELNRQRIDVGLLSRDLHAAVCRRRGRHSDQQYPDPKRRDRRSRTHPRRRVSNTVR